MTVKKRLVLPFTTVLIILLLLGTAVQSAYAGLINGSNQGSGYDDNLPPVASDDNANTSPDVPVTVNVLVNDSDPDGDILIVTETTFPAHGKVSINPDQTITYYVASGFIGVDCFTYTVSDERGGEASASVNINVLPLADDPLVISPTDQNNAEGDLISLQINTTTPPGTQLTFNATNLPGGLGIDSDTGLISGLLDFSTAGTYQVMITASGPGDLSGNTSFLWTVTDIPEPSQALTVDGNLSEIPDQPPDQPILDSPGDLSTVETPSTTLDISVTDPDSSNLTVSFYGRAISNVSNSADFTIAVLPDTQYYSMNYPSIFNAQTRWIIGNQITENIVYVTQLGDIVYNGDILGGNLNTREWQNAWSAMNLLENPFPGISYGVAVGNHDQSPGGDPNGSTSFFNHYFGIGHFSAQSTYGGFFGSNNDNHYDLFSASGLDFIAIYLEYDLSANSNTLKWADQLLKTYNNRRAIVISHYMLERTNPPVFSTQGAKIYNALKGNPNLFLMLCGHWSTELMRTDTYNGNTVYTVMTDYQKRANGGNGWMRLLEFSPGNNEIRSKVYTPVFNQWEIDGDSQFSLSYQMDAPEFRLLGTNQDIVLGTNTSIVWDGLFNTAKYEWYATVSDDQTTTTGPVWSFSTAIIPPNSLNVSLIGNGTVIKSPDRSDYYPVDSVQLMAIPAVGWHFDNWTGDNTGTANPAIIPMDRSKSVTAAFSMNHYTLTINKAGVGTVSKFPDQSTYVYGDVVSLSATPETGWYFSVWSGSVIDNKVTIYGNTVVTAIFLGGTSPVTTPAVEGTIIIQDGEEWYLQAAMVTLTSNVPGTTYYCIQTENESACDPYGHPYIAPIQVDAVGINIVRFYSVDQVGNPEAFQSITIRIKPPTDPGQLIISGEVKDRPGDPVQGVLVKDGQGHSAITDASGQYLIQGLPAGNYTLTAEKDQYMLSPNFVSINLVDTGVNQDFIADAPLFFLLSPVPGQNLASRNAGLSWQSLKGAHRYVVYTSFNGVNFTRKCMKHTTACWIRVPNYLRVFWRVDAFGENNAYLGNSAVTWFQAPYTPSAPTNLAPAGRARLGTQPILSWRSSQPGWAVNHYVLSVVGWGIVTLPGNTTSYTIPPHSELKPGSSYKWRVQACNVINQCSKWSRYGYIDTRPPTPILLSPDEGQVGTPLKPVLNWWNDGITQRYQVQVSNTPGFIRPLVFNSKASSITVQRGLRLSTKYYWRVRAQHRKGFYGEWSDIQYFTIIQ